MARPKYQARLDDVVERAVDVGIDAVFERVTDFFNRSTETQRVATAAIPAELRRSAYKCGGCHKMFPFDGLEMVSATADGYGTCKKCFKFMWDSANEKLAALKQGVSGFAKNAAKGTRARPAGAEPPGPKPWEILGVDPDVSIEDLKKAYRKHAAASHPDRVPPGASTEEKDRARERFEEVDRAYKVMMKVRSPPT